MTPDDVRALHTEGELLRLFAEQRRIDLAECLRRRAAVLRHPDLAARLCEPPMKLGRPDQWTGYAGAQYTPGRMGFDVNRAPTRAQLVAIVREAEQRDGIRYLP